MKQTPLERKSELKRGEGPKRKSAPKRSQPKRDWTQARAKVEHAPCRLCAPDENCGPVEAAHVIGREYDRPKERLAPADEAEQMADRLYGPRGTVLLVHPDSVIPLGRGHHKLYDARQADVLPVLSIEEQLRAVEDAGGIENARIRTCPSQYERGAA